MGLEFELKYSATGEIRQAIAAAFPGNWHTIAMETTYYDTPGGDLAARRYTLRRRLENGKAVCTVKTPGDGFGRGEWDVECTHIESAVEELCKLGGPQELSVLAEQGLIPICGARFTRRALTVQLEDCQVELALDEGVLLGGGKELPLGEVEVELKSGSQTGALAFANALAGTFHLSVEKKSKFRRALELAKGG